MKVRARKLLSLLLTLAMVAGMFVMPASAAGTTEAWTFIAEDDHAKIGTTDYPISNSGTTNSLQSGKATNGEVKYGERTLNKCEKFDSKPNFSFTTAVEGTIKIGYTVKASGNGFKLGSTTVTSTNALKGEVYINEALAAGTYSIVRSSGEAYIYYIEWTPNSADPSVAITPKTAQVKVGATTKLTANVSNAADATVTWSSDNTSLATVESDGTVTGVAVGTANIKAEIEVSGTKYSATCAVEVISADTATPKTFKLSTTMAAMAAAGIKDQEPLLLGPVYNSGYFSFTGDAADGLKFRSGPYIEIGKAEANNGITFTTNSTSTVTVTVGSGNSAKYAVVALKNGSGEMQMITTGTKGTGSNKGDEMILLNGTDCTATGTAGTDAKAALYKGTSKDAKVVWADLPAGTYTVYSPAVTNFNTIDATAENDPAERGGRIYELAVAETDGKDAPDVEDKEVTKVTVTPATASIAVGETADLEFAVEPEDALNRRVDWSSSDTGVATVEIVKGKVVVTGVAAGTADIVAKSNKTPAISGKCTVTVSEDKTLKGLTPDKSSVTLKTGATTDVTITTDPTNTDDTLTVSSSDEGVATATVSGKKVTITANDTKAGEAKITVSGTTATSVKAEISVTVELKKMKDSGSAQQSGVYKPGFVPFTAKAKAVDADTGADIPGVSYTYSVNGRDGNYTSTVPSIDKPGMVTYFYKANATGYEEFTSSTGRNMTISKGEPELSITAKPNRVKDADDAKRFTIITVDCTNIEGANVNNIVVSGKNLTADQELLKNRFVKQSDGVYKVSFPEPDVSEAEYVFTASFGGNDYYKEATDQTARVTVVNSTVVDRTYKLTYDTNTIKIKFTSDGSTADAVLLGAGVEAEAIVPEGKEFVKWVSADLDPTDENWDTQNPTKFAMPGHDVTLSVVFQDKSEEPATPVNRTALVGALRTAEAYAEVPAVDTKAENVAKGDKWVLKADKDTFLTAIAKAQAVSSNDKATQAEVDKAVEDLDKATDAFTATWKDGTKSSGSSEPVVVTKTFESKTLTTSAADGPYPGDNYFTLAFGEKGKVDTSKKQWKEADFGEHAYDPSGDNAATAVSRFNMGGASKANGPGIKFTTTSADAKVQIWWVQGGGVDEKDANKTTPVRQMAILDADLNKVAATELTDANSKKNDPHYSELTIPTAGTYMVGSLDGSNYIFKIVVTETTTSGGDTPVTPDSAARKALKEAVAAAKAAVEAANVSTDGEDVSTSEQWVTAAIKTAYENAIELAEAKANSPRFDDEALTAAKTALENSTNVFEAAKRDGKKSSGSTSGGSSSGNVPSTGGGTTVTNPDGSKTNTKTNKTTGTVTETTTWPNGDKKVVVTTKDGTVTETVTKKDGTKSETVTKPDGAKTETVTDAKGIKTETAVSASGDTTAKVTLPKHIDKALVTIPVKDATEGTVAVIVDSKGNETVIKTAIANENGLELLVSGNVSVKIKDNAKSFQDIADGYWAKGAVDFVSSREIFKGTTDVTFSPMDEVNRGMMATVLYRLADGKADGDNIFSDVTAGTWYTDAVIWANRSGVVNGYTDKTFGPADAVTREQMATMLFRFAKVMKMDLSAKGDLAKFSDANDVSSWASEAVTWAVGVGLINGVADPVTGTVLAPTKTASRAEVATILQRMVKLMMK